MSMVVYSDDYISIIGNIITDEADDVPLEDVGFKCLHLIFNIQVNGKLRIHEHNYNLDRSNSLDHWWEWYATLNLLTDIWYRIWDYRWGGTPGTRIIQEWIDKLVESRKQEEE